MADKEASLLIKLKDEVSSGLSSMKASILAVSATIAGLTAFLVSAVREFAESETAINRMNLALKNQGIFTESLSKEMVAYASQLQRVTAFSDESVIATQATLTTFGLAGRELKDTTLAALNLSSAMGIDLNTATLLLGKAFQGQTESLGRYGIKVDESIPKSERFAAVMEILNSRFGGAAQAEMNTTAGRIANLKNAFSDLAEEIGGMVAPVLIAIITHLRSAIDTIQNLGGIINSLAIMSLQAFAQSLNVLINSVPGLSLIFRALGLDMDSIQQKLDQQIQSMIRAAETETQTNQTRLLDSNIKTQQRISLEKKWTEEAKKESQKRQDEAQKENEKRVKLDLDSIERRRKAEEAANAARVQNLSSTLNFISSLSTAKNKQLAAIGKAAAISVATMDTYAAANKALASAPPPFNFALAAAVVAAGLVNVAKISGVALAEGGLVMPTAGGIPAIVGEGGSPELVLPLNDSRTKEALGESGLGGMTLNLHVGVLVGSDNSVRELARLIDREMLSLRRNNESVAFGAI